MTASKKEFDIYLEAYHQWEIATREYYRLINQGDEAAFKEIEILTPKLDALHKDFMEKYKKVVHFKPT